MEVLLHVEAHLDDLRAAFTVEVEGGGRRLDVVVAEKLGVSARIARVWVAAGRVRLDGRAVRVGAPRLASGQRVVILGDAARPELLPEAIPLTVLACDASFLFVDKPAGMVVMPGDGHPAGTLVNALRGLGLPLSELEGPLRPGIVHRLDRGTSGVMVVARNDDSHRQAVAAFLAHAVRRRYVALCHGRPDWNELVVEAPLARARAHRKAQGVRPDGRSALTRFVVLERLAGCALVLAMPETGRTHQVRVHLRHVGHPLCGDTLYAGGDRERRLLWGRLGVGRPMLHAERLELLGRAVTAPWPDDLTLAATRARAE